MQINICPWTGNERLNYYRHSQQLAGQTGLIGKLRADFGSDGSGSYSTGEDIRKNINRIEGVGAKVDPINEPIKVLRENYYCPLKITVFECDEYDDIEEEGYDYDGRYAVRYEDEIRELLKREHSFEGCDPRSMATYQDDPKVLSAEWDVTEVRGTLYGVIRVDLSAPLSLTEEKKLKSWICGQNSDGFGEGLEQRDFEIDSGEAYVSFWNGGNDYFIKNENEFRQYLNNQTMGGMQLT